MQILSVAQFEHIDEGQPAARLPGAELHELRFRDYRLLPRARLLLKGANAVPTGSRAFDILHALVRARGTVVGKEEIVDAAWPTTTVDESNLRFQIAQLRKTLGTDRDLVKTIPGRGYLFCEENAASHASDNACDAPQGPAPEHTLVALSHLGQRREPASDSVQNPSDAQSLLLAFLAACGLPAVRPVVLLIDLGVSADC